MPEKTFTLKIVTPEREVLNDEVVSVTVPGTVGQFGVLADHAPLISQTEIGVLGVMYPDGREVEVALSGGYATVRENELTVLVASAERADEIDVERAQAARERAEHRLAGEAPDVDKARAEQALQRALTRLKVASWEQGGLP